MPRRWVGVVGRGPTGCVIDRGDAFQGTSWISEPYFALSNDGATLYASDGEAGIRSFSYPGGTDLGNYIDAPTGFHVLDLAVLPSGDVVWVEANNPWTSFSLRYGTGSTLLLSLPSGYNQWRIRVSPYDDELYVVSEETGADGDLELWRVDGGSLTLMSGIPAQDLDIDLDMIGMACTADGGVWVSGGNGNVGRFDIPTSGQHYSPDNDDPGGGVMTDGVDNIGLLPQTDNTVAVVSSDGQGKVLTWTGSAITIGDDDCFDGFEGGISAWSADLSVVAWNDNGDGRTYELL